MYQLNNLQPYNPYTPICIIVTLQYFIYYLFSYNVLLVCKNDEYRKKKKKSCIYESF